MFWQMQQNTMYRVHRAEAAGKTERKVLAMAGHAEFGTVLQKIEGV